MLVVKKTGKLPKDSKETFDFTGIKFDKFLDSSLVMNHLDHSALPYLFPDQIVLVKIDENADQDTEVKD